MLGPEEGHLKTTASYEVARAMNAPKPVEAPPQVPPYSCAGCPERGHKVTHNGMPGKCIDGRFWSNGELTRMREIKTIYGEPAVKQMTSRTSLMLRELLDLDYANAEVTLTNQ